MLFISLMMFDATAPLGEKNVSALYRVSGIEGVGWQVMAMPRPIPRANTTRKVNNRLMFISFLFPFVILKNASQEFCHAYKIMKFGNSKTHDSANIELPVY